MPTETLWESNSGRNFVSTYVGRGTDEIHLEVVRVNRRFSTPVELLLSVEVRGKIVSRRFYRPVWSHGFTVGFFLQRELVKINVRERRQVIFMVVDGVVDVIYRKNLWLQYIKPCLLYIRTKFSWLKSPLKETGVILIPSLVIKVFFGLKEILTFNSLCYQYKT